MATQSLKYTTPKGRAQYPWLTAPDTKYDSDGVYTTGIIVPAAEAKDLMEEIRQFSEDTLGPKAKSARLPFKVDNEVGEVTFTAKTKFEPKFFDSSGQIIVSNIPKVFGGSVLAAAGTFTPYDLGSNCGIKMNLTRVQIIELAEGSNDDAGFDAVEGGYIAQAIQQDTFEGDGGGEGFDKGNF